MAVKNGVPDAILGGMYPFEDRYVQLSDGTNLHYVESGRAGFRRPTVLLLHGNPTWSFAWRNVMPGLAGAARVVALDLAGFGRSDHPRDVAYHTLERHIANLEEFAARVRLKRVVVAAQDWGGPIGLGYATRHPEDIQGLLLMNTWAFTTHEPLRLPLWYRAMRARGVGELAYRRRNTFIESILPRLLRNADAAVLDGYRHPFPTPGSRAGPLGLTRMVPDRPSHPDWPTMDRIEKALPGLEAPARILWGRHDPAFPMRFAKAFQTILPNAEAPKVVDAGHYVQEDVPEWVVQEARDLLRTL